MFIENSDEVPRNELVESRHESSKLPLEPFIHIIFDHGIDIVCFVIFVDLYVCTSGRELYRDDLIVTFFGYCEVFVAEVCNVVLPVKSLSAHNRTDVWVTLTAPKSGYDAVQHPYSPSLPKSP